MLKIGEKINGWLAIGAFGSVRNVTNVRSAFLCDICVRSYLAEIFGRVFGRVLPGFNWWLGIRWTSRHNELSHSRGCSQRHCQSDPSDKYMIQDRGAVGPRLLVGGPSGLTRKIGPRTAGPLGPGQLGQNFFGSDSLDPGA